MAKKVRNRKGVLWYRHEVNRGSIDAAGAPGQNYVDSRTMPRPAVTLAPHERRSAGMGRSSFCSSNTTCPERPASPPAASSFWRFFGHVLNPLLSICLGTDQ